MGSRLFDEIRELLGAVAHVVLVETAFGKAPEKSPHAVFQDFAARRKQRRRRRDHAAERDKIVLVAAGAVQQQQRTRLGLVAFLKALNKGQGQCLGHQAVRSVACSSGSTASISLRRASRNGGNFKSWPRVSTGSSTAKPGTSVAISNRIPPGSRK